MDINYKKTKQYEIEQERNLNLQQKEILNNYVFPKFEYHANPRMCECLIVEENGKMCDCCKTKKQILFECDGCYGDFPEGLVLCPECIASGEAGKKYDIEFNLVSDEIEDENKNFKVIKCTPPILSWNDMEFKTHCGDYAEYIGPAYWQDIENLGNEAINNIDEDLKLNYEIFYVKLKDLKKVTPNRDCGMHLHLFRCKHCGKYLIQIDLD